MEVDKFINLFITISEKAINLSGSYDDNTIEAETLHTALALALRELTEKQYSLIPLVYRKTIEKVEAKLLKYVSDDYKLEYEQLVNNGGKFRKPKTEAKKTIGFNV